MSSSRTESAGRCPARFRARSARRPVAPSTRAARRPPIAAASRGRSCGSWEASASPATSP